jgi:hypothetical protein
MKVFYAVLVVLLILSGSIANRLAAQSTAFVVGGGSSIGTQRWGNSFQRQPLFAWHGTLAIETVNNDDDRSSLFVQLGYHQKGSAVRFWNIQTGGNYFQATEKFKFNNLSLILGAKQKKPLGSGQSKYFYFGGIRADYTVSTNLGELQAQNQLNSNPYAYAIYPFEGFVKKFVGGVSVGGGVQLPLTELIGAELKVSLHPDFTYQYNQPPIPNVIVYDPTRPGQSVTIEQRQIRNTTLEISLCLRFLRKVIYE